MYRMQDEDNRFLAKVGTYLLTKLHGVTSWETVTFSHPLLHGIQHHKLTPLNVLCVRNHLAKKANKIVEVQLQVFFT